MAGGMDHLIWLTSDVVTRQTSSNQMNSNFEWHLTNKLQGDQNWWKELATDCAFKIQNVSVFSWVTQGPQVLPDVVDVDGSVEGQGDHLRHLSHLEIT